MSQSHVDNQIPRSGPGSRGIDAASTGAKATEKQLRSFVGQNADYYLAKWAALRTTGRGPAGFNLAAFVIPDLWLPYRKMYLFAIAYWAVFFLYLFAEHWLFVGILGVQAPPSLIYFFALLVRVVCASEGNRWYLSRARKAVARVGSEGLEQSAALELLSKRGGRSPGSVVVFYVVGLAILFIAEHGL